MTQHDHPGFDPTCYRCDLGLDEVKNAEREARVEDVARTLHYAQSLNPADYYAADYHCGWENENVTAIKRYRNMARDLIDKMDQRDDEENIV